MRLLTHDQNITGWPQLVGAEGLLAAVRTGA